MMLKDELQGWLDQMARSYAVGDAAACARMFSEDATLGEYPKAWGNCVFGMI